MKQVYLLNLGLEPYQRAWDLQHRLVDLRRQEEIPDVLILLEHPPVITIGRRGNESNILVSREFLASQGIEVYHVERGGDVTYHGPGQLVGYPVMDLTRHKKDVGWYIHSLEEVLIRVLDDFGIVAESEDGNIGVWVAGKKIAALGARIERWITYHGFALNIAPNMQHFNWIVPCGVPGKEVTSMLQVLGYAPEMQSVRESFARHFSEVYNVEVQEISLEHLLKEGALETSTTLVS